jgi:outer membrane protein OmpA-like peptidoglycan-associated protein
VQARLAFGTLLALGLADLAVLDLHLAPQLADATKEVQQPVRPQAADRSAPVTTGTPPALSVTMAPAPVEPPPVAVATNTPAPSIAIGAIPTAAATVAAVTPPTKATPDPKTTGKSPAGKGSVAALPPPDPVQDVIFVLDSHQITSPQAITELTHAARELAAAPGRRLLIRGHSDQMGTPEYKRNLSLRRAMTVQNFLVSHGAPADRISLEAVGDTDPADPGNNPVAWARNRRVQLVWR